MVVTVQPLMLRWKWSAVARYTRAAAWSPFTSAIRPAATSPAISAAMVDGEWPPCSSHRSDPKDGPWETTKSAAFLTWSVHSARSPWRPAW